jgi:DNA-binding NarL/FixJ family response regulator
VPVRVFHGDDSEPYRHLISVVLDGPVEVVGGAGEPDEVVAGVARMRPDVVLLDQIGDAGIVDRIRDVSPGTCVVILSGYSPGDGDGGFADRADAYLVKEHDVDELRAAILSAAAR